VQLESLEYGTSLPSTNRLVIAMTAVGIGVEGENRDSSQELAICLSAGCVEDLLSRRYPLRRFRNASTMRQEPEIDPSSGSLRELSQVLSLRCKTHYQHRLTGYIVILPKPKKGEYKLVLRNNLGTHPLN
jgi:hypothetical protein